MVEAAREAQLDCRIIDATTVVADTASGVLDADGEAPTDLPDVVLARVGNWRPDSLLALVERYTVAGVPTPNPAPAIRIGRDHWRTALVLSEAGLPVPPTVAGSDPEALAAAARRWGFPVVVKHRRSRMGVGVIRCASLDHLEAVLDSMWRLGDEVVVQRYRETGGVSLRLLVIAGRVVAAARFTAATGDWRSNAARGGQVAACRPEAADHALAVAATQAVGLGICGVDLLPGADGTEIGEVNPTPGFTHLERATGIDVAAAMVAHLAAIAR